MQAKKSVFRPIALAVSALISTGAFAQNITVGTMPTTTGDIRIESAAQVGTAGVPAYQSTLSDVSLRFENQLIQTSTEVSGNGILTNALSGGAGALEISGIVDFTHANVTGLGLFNPAEVTTTLIGGTMVQGGTTTAPTSSFQSSGYSVDLSSGAATLGATTLGATTTTTLRTTGMAILDSVAVTGTTATRGITNTGDIATTTLSTSGNATVGGTLAVTGATTTHGIENTGLLKNTGIFLATSAPQVQGQPNTGIQIDSSQAMMGTNDGTNITALRMGMSDGVSGPAQLLGNLVVTSAFRAGLDGTSETVGANGGNLTVMGTTTLNGATTVNNTLNVNGATTVVGATSITGATTVVGTTNINTTGTAATSIGNSAAPVAVTGSTASFTGGTTNLTLNDNGATFSNAGSPAKVTGIANGTGDFDAVNVRQFSAAVAGVAASANIPGLDTNKAVSVGVGMGSFMNSQALAFGGSYRFSDKGVLRASLATGLNNGGGKTSFGIGAGWSW